MDHLQRAIDIAGGQSALARALGVAQQHVWNWLIRSNGQVPAEHCPAIEKSTGGLVRCEELRPDIEWSVLRQPHPAGRPCLDVAAPVETV